MGTVDLRKAVAHLRGSDPVLAGLIKRVGPCRWEADSSPDSFSALVESIIYQQLQGNAAKAISQRFQNLFGGTFPTPVQLKDLPPREFRAAGISPQKEAAMRDLASKVSSGALRLGELPKMADEEVMASLVQVRGIGEWTAQMFLIFHLLRPDVLPTGDYGLRKAVQREYHLRALPDSRRLERLAEPWRPHRTVAT